MDTVKSLFLGPFSFLWESLCRIRRLVYKLELIASDSFRVPIISVGNLTFGGTGKTPLTIWLAKYLIEQKKSPLVLMRGYRGKLENSFGIIKKGDKQLNARDFGDEAVLIAKRVPKASVLVGKNRSQNLRYFYDELCSDAVILDDGFQHLKIKRDLNILLFDCSMELKNYKVAPLGYLREGLKATEDADVIILGKCNQVPEQIVQEHESLISAYLSKDVLIVKTGLKALDIFDINFKKIMDIADLGGKKVFLFSGIASPYSFFSLVESLGAHVVKRFTFPDHYYFKKKEIEALVKEAREQDCIILTTEKDIMRLKEFDELWPICFLAIDVVFLSGEEEFKQMIKRIL
jgi:tetraacyldisaccharide 4'-kinase